MWCSSLGSVSVLSCRATADPQLTQSPRSFYTAHQLQYSYFHSTLIEVSRFVLDNLDSHDLVSPNVLAFRDLPESPLSENIENEISFE
jgi:hypothetical protein